MCGRFSLNHKRDELEELFGADFPREFAPRYNIAPTQPVLIVRDHPHREGMREAAHVVWGLIPPWADTPSLASKMINARCETAADKPSFKNPLRRRRCLVPVSGFYEWQTVAGRKQPYYIYNVDRTPLGLAGIWEIWSGPDGELIESCSILTTAANSTLRGLHERMPVIVPPDKFPLWLDTQNDDSATLTSFWECRCIDLTMHAVSTDVNRPANDHRMLIDPINLI